jgi:2-methylaconitate cis-trans-isomerase PrpF
LVAGGNSSVWVGAAEIGSSGDELADDNNSTTAVLDTISEIRGRAALLMGMANDWKRGDDQSPAHTASPSKSSASAGPPGDSWTEPPTAPAIPHES